MVGILQSVLPHLPALPGVLVRFLSRFADTLADAGQLETARWFYDELHRLEPAEIDRYLRQYEALGGRLFLLGRRPDGMRYWVMQRQIQHRLAEEHGLLPSTIAYLAPDWSWAYGHLGLIHLYIKYHLLREHPPQLILLAKRGSIANQALLDHYRPWLEIDDSPDTARTLPAILLGDGLTILRSDSGDYVYMMDALLDARRRWQAQGRPPLMRLSDEERDRGNALLLKLGLDPEGWFVCLHVRDGDTAGDRYARNARLETYHDAIQVITRAGGRVIRIGSKLDRPSGIPHLVDYASTSLRSDWADVFFSAACRFFLGTNSGPCLIPEGFGVPTATANWHPFGEGPFGGHYICKLLWHEKEQRYLTFAEMLQPPFASTERQALLHQHHVRLVDNTAEDISLLVEEMLRVVEGKMTYTAEQEQDQAAFQKVMQEFQPAFQTRLGAAFLAQHRDLLVRG